MSATSHPVLVVVREQDESPEPELRELLSLQLAVLELPTPTVDAIVELIVDALRSRYSDAWRELERVAQDPFAHIDPPIWLRRDNEGEAAFEAFRCYMEVDPPRAVVKAWPRYAMAQNLDHTADPPSHFYGWAREFEWRERGQAFEDHVFALQLEKKVAMRRRAEAVLTERAAEIMHAAIDAALEKQSPTAFKDLLDRIAGSGLARSRAQGDATTHHHTHYQQVLVDVKNASVEQLLELALRLSPLIDVEPG